MRNTANQLLNSAAPMPKEVTRRQYLTSQRGARVLMDTFIKLRLLSVHTGESVQSTATMFTSDTFVERLFTIDEMNQKIIQLTHDRDAELGNLMITNFPI